MLRSTGFFRGIDCPFYSESHNGKIVKNGCNRPYCHFRHSNQRRTSYGGFEVRKTKEIPSNEEGYDPFSPEVGPSDHRNEEPAAKPATGHPVDGDATELELVNRAIQAVQCEVEREKRKLSHMGDQEYEPTSKSSTVDAKRKKTAPLSHTGVQEYEPTARSSTVDIKQKKSAPLSHTGVQEYEPTARSSTVDVKLKKTGCLSHTSVPEYEPTARSSTVDVKQKKTVSLSHTVVQEYEPTARSSTVDVKQKKTVSLSHTADQDYEPTARSSTVDAKRKKTSPVVSHQGYDPGSYQMTQGTDYSPTPRSNKYILDSESEDSHGSPLEYVPTAVNKAASKKSLLFSPTKPPSSPSPSPQSSTSVKCKYTVDKGKYTLDTSKPATDMEYDPLSNFSAKPSSKSKDQRASTSEKDSKTSSPPTSKRKHSVDEEYVPTVKKQRPPAVDSQKYTASFSESDGESSGMEYRPTKIGHLQRRKSSSGSAEDGSRRSSEEKVDITAPSKVLTQQKHQNSRPEENSSRRDSDDLDEGGPKQTPKEKEKATEKKVKDKDNQKKSSKTEDEKREEKRSSGKTGSSEKERKGSSSSSDKKKKPSSESVKKTDRTEEKNKLKDKAVHKSKKEEKSSDEKSKRPEKVKGESGGHKEKDRTSSEVKKHKSDKTHEKDSSKYKEQKNGKLLSVRKDKDKTKSLHGSGSSGDDKSSKKSSLSSSSSSSSKAAKLGKEKHRSLSHVDLFGDESGEEEENIVRKSASAHRQRSSAPSHNNKKMRKMEVVDLTHSRSEEELSQEDDRSDDDDDGDDPGDVDDGIDYSCLADLDLDYDDPMEECLQIFNESKDVKMEDKGRQAKQPVDSDASESTLSTVVPGQKKRVSHFKEQGGEPVRASVVRPYARPTAQEICYKRMQMAQKQAEQLAAAVKVAAKAKATSTSTASSSSSSSPFFAGEKKRVAHRPNPSALSLKASSEAKQGASRVLSPTRPASEQPAVKSHTMAGILSKTSTTTMQKRVAHTPTMKSSSMKRPVIPCEFGAKVATGVRQRYLNLFIDECLKVCPSEPEAFQMALDEEQVVYERSSSKNIYLNVAVNTLKKLRNKSTSPAAKPPKYQAASSSQKAQSHEKTLGGRMAAKTSFTINRQGKQQAPEVKGASLYYKLKEYLMTEEQLQEHNYPRVNPDHPGHAIIYNLPEKKNLDPFSKVCCRCGHEYKINVNGSCVRKEECNHHWGRLRRHKVSGGWETQYSCCSGAVGSTGCQVAKQHVQDGRKESLNGYVKTFDKSLPADGDAGVFALDCEMCYTKTGLELTRVTVINSELKVIYDTFVKPEAKVVDYNTRFSGVTEEDLENTTITLRDVQAVLLSMFSAESILIGHSLESDLLALKLLHSTVVDTAIVFPHRLGLPYKRALRNLMADHLKRIIQDNVEGHDSSEDACACMELMIWKIKEDAKVKR
ncbi:RNA exonuclease 1 homolog isoform X2 [Engraulis encrasicolus]|uniref:RNA exonuclease 1 homolog isoform X2 n=1 Tax=Engraulis encrasicolus TaxID=184585 RepID=UPI002FD08B96